VDDRDGIVEKPPDQVDQTWMTPEHLSNHMLRSLLATNHYILCFSLD